MMDVVLLQRNVLLEIEMHLSWIGNLSTLHLPIVSAMFVFPSNWCQRIVNTAGNTHVYARQIHEQSFCC